MEIQPEEHMIGSTLEAKGQPLGYVERNRRKAAWCDRMRTLRAIQKEIAGKLPAMALCHAD